MGKGKFTTSGLGLVLAAALILCGSGPASLASRAAEAPDYLHWPSATAK